MAKRVVVIASGETERRAIPHLVQHLQDRDVELSSVAIPSNNRDLNADMAAKLIASEWFSATLRPSKFVILVDADGKDPDEILQPFRESLPSRLPRGLSPGAVLYVCAQWHLEAWYFADADNLRDYLERPLGSVDTSSPDAIQNPKLRLKNLLADKFYTARVSEEIAKRLDARAIIRRSPSFRTFITAVENGPAQGNRILLR